MDWLLGLSDTDFRRITELGGVLSGLATFIAVVIGVWQYRKTQNWNRAKLASDLIEKFFSDPASKAAMALLDWTEGSIQVPQGLHAKGNHGETLQHTRRKMSDAFSMANRALDSSSQVMELKPEFLRTDLVIYVRVFDSFFEEVSRMASFVEAGSVRPKELKQLAYWLNRLTDASFEKRAIFIDYLKYYKYWEVLWLAKKLRRFAR